MSSFVLKNGLVFVEGQLKKKDVEINHDKITKIGEDILSEKILDCQGKWILPGVIDPHVHFRTPGMEHKEDWVSGSRSALVGGITSVIDMPNTNPPTTTSERLNQKREIARTHSKINYGFHFGAENNNLDEIKKVKGIASIKVYFGSSTGNLLVHDPIYLTELLNITKVPICFHAEDEDMIQKNLKQTDIEKTPIHLIHNTIRNDEVALSAVQKILAISESFPNPIYFCHVSTQKEVKAIEMAKKTKNIKLEVTPHHLFLTEDIIKEIGHFGKVNPPLRNDQNRQYLYQALLENKIDTIGSDHAPHLKEEKEKEYSKAPSGMPGLETLLPLLLTEVIQNRLSINQLVDYTSTNSAKIFSIKNKGLIQPGYDADLVIIDPTIKYSFSSKNIVGKAGWTPFENTMVTGKINQTIVNGELAYDNGLFYDTSSGRELNYSS